MTQREQISIVVEKPDFSKATFIDFEVEREDWNEYRLKDGTFLRAKLVFSGFLMDKNIDELAKEVKLGKKLNVGLGFKSTPVFGVELPHGLRGTPDPTQYSKAQLQALITEEVDFETTKAVWNSYLLKNGIRIKVRLSPVSISRTSKFDDAGIPVYWVEYGVDVKIMLPERIEKILAKEKQMEKSKLQ